ncbi:MAG TPA: cell wall-binding repeat-containing protein [Acidimicrobiales bacterium]|nr:cell wall-binding repeat-containing protein [Acidimicrobiales bacterium]
MRRALLVAGVLAASLVVPGARADVPVQRLSGTDRYTTAEAVATALHPDGATQAVLATGTAFPDALTAGVAAAALDAPLLLASPERLPLSALDDLGVVEVVLVGGTAVFPASAEQALVDAGLDVVRVAGDDRYETAAAVAELTTAEHVVRAPGTSFPTALVAAAHAARVGAHLLLTPDLADDEVTVDGELVQGPPGQLNLSLLRRDPPSGEDAVVTTISTFPDALSATAVAGALDVPVLFTQRHSATQPAIDALDRYGADGLVVVGGTAAVSDVVLQQLVGFVPLPPVVGPDAEAAIAYDLFVRINDERAARWAPPLEYDASLAADAAAWAREMSRSGYRHATLGGNLGENIHERIGRCEDGVCTYPTSGLLHRDWMASADNRDNVVEPGYAIGGVGVYCAPDGTLWAVERFGIGYGGLSAGGSPATPVARTDLGGFDCTGAHS